MVSEIEQAG